MNLPEQVKVVGDIVAVPTGLMAAIGAILGVVQVVVGIAAGVLAGAYTAYRIYDLWDQRRRRNGAGPST